jgi:hypothetical protein
MSTPDDPSHTPAPGPDDTAALPPTPPAGPQPQPAQPQPVQPQPGPVPRAGSVPPPGSPAYGAYAQPYP